MQGIFSLNNGILNASQSKLLESKKLSNKTFQSIELYDQINSNNFIFPKENVFNPKNNFEYRNIELATISLPSEFKDRKILKIRFDELFDLITKNNSEYKAAYQRVEQSKNRLLATISTKRPTIDLNSNGLPEYLFIDHYTNPNISGTSYKKSEQWKTSISASIRWDIINPKRNPQINASKKTFEKAKNSFIIVRRDLVLKAKIDFINLKKAQEKLIISENAVEISAQSLKDVRLRNKALVASDLEVLEAENQLSRDQMFLNKSMRDLNKANRSLSNVLGLDNSKKIIAYSESILLGEWERTLEESIASALGFRLSLINYDLDVSINKDKSKEELGNSRPKVSLVNTFTISKDMGQTEIIPPVNPDDYEKRVSNTIGLFGEWKVFDAGKSRELSKFYKNKSIEAEYKSQKEKSLIIKEVENNYIDLETAIQNIFSTSRAIIKNNKMLQISRMRFKAGVTNQREIVNLQRDLKQSQINYLDSISNYNVSIARLQRSTGLTKLGKCNTTNLEGDFNSIDQYSLYKLPIIPINKACEISVIIKSINEIKANIPENENIEALNKNKNKETNKDNSKIIDSYLQRNSVKNNKNNNIKIIKPPKAEEKNKIDNDKDIKKLNYRFKKGDQNNSSYNKKIGSCSTLIKDSDICLDNFVD